MAFVQRDQQGNIVAVFDSAQPEAHEFISLTSPELQEFLARQASPDDAKTLLSTSDHQLIRVLEDLINTLIDKGIILFTDLPLAAREKLANREKIRDRLSSLENLMNEDDNIL